MNVINATERIFQNNHPQKQFMPSGMRIKIRKLFHSGNKCTFWRRRTSYYEEMLEFEELYKKKRQQIGFLFVK